MSIENIKLSVIVSTKDRSQILKNCLDSLVDQTKKRKNVELLIVNNNSSDDTVRIVHQYINKIKNWRLITETQIGLSHARNRGWQESKGEYVAYIDDDAIADKDWVEQIISFANNHPRIGVFGGPYTGYTVSPRSSWLPKKYGSHSLGNKVRQVDIGNEWISGTNMVFKKKLIQKFKGFDVKLGMRGKKISYGEETNLLLRMYREGVSVYYNPKMKVKHLIPDYKNNLMWQLKNNYAIGYSWYPTHARNANLLMSVYTLLGSIKKAFFYLSDPAKIPFKRRIYLFLSGPIQETGVLMWHLSRFFSMRKRKVWSSTIKSLNYILDKPWLLFSEIKMIVTNMIALIVLASKGIRIITPFKFYGLPKIFKHRGSLIKIGHNFENRNWFLSNPLVIDHPTVLATMSSRAKVIIGNDVGISGGNIVASNKILIGNSTMIGSNCLIIDTDFHPLNAKNRRHSKKGVSSKPIKIGKNVFIGTRSTILKGVTIGDNSIIGAGSVVRKDIPANSIFVNGRIKKIR